MQKNRVQNLTLVALMAAILCIMGPFVIPIGMVPMSLTNMVIYLTIIILDKKRATISVGIYLLIGFVGIPVFAGFTGGAGKLLGSTGGYLLGYLVLSWIAGMILEIFDKTEHKKDSVGTSFDKVTKGNYKIKQVLALVIGTISLYFIGTLWLMLQSKLTFIAALAVGVAPFIVFDAIKIVVAVMLGSSVKKRIRNIL